MGRHPSTTAPKATPKVKAKPEPVAKGKGRKAKKTEDTIPVLPESVQAKYKEQWQQFAKVKPAKDCLLVCVILRFSFCFSFVVFQFES